MQGPVKSKESSFVGIAKNLLVADFTLRHSMIRWSDPTAGISSEMSRKRAGGKRVFGRRRDCDVCCRCSSEVHKRLTLIHKKTAAVLCGIKIAVQQGPSLVGKDPPSSPPVLLPPTTSDKFPEH